MYSRYFPKKLITNLNNMVMIKAFLLLVAGR
jgi:hypothetical protein